jgi:hypothetical protein
MRYAGTVLKRLEDGKEYEYIKFYLPEQKERSITDGQYWRDKRYQYSKLEQFNSLLKQGEIVFK